MIAIPACSAIATPRGSRDLVIGAGILHGESASFFFCLYHRMDLFLEQVF